VGLTLAMILGTGGLGLFLAFRRFGRDPGIETAQYWLAGHGGALILLLVAVWVARRGDMRPFYIAIGSASIAGIISLVDWLAPALVRNPLLDWTVAGMRFPTRLSGVIASPNAVAATIVVPMAFWITTIVRGPSRRWRIAAVVMTLPLVAALVFTYSRAGLLAIFAVGVVLVWQWRRIAGAALLATGVVVGILLLPSYLNARANAVGGASEVQEGSFLVASDQQRFTAWNAALRMTEARPLLGFGFRSYKQLAHRYGDNVLGSPHNDWLRPFAEEGIVVGALGIAWGLSLLWALSRRRGWLTTAVFAGLIGWSIMATFNNPFLFVQVATAVFIPVGSMVAPVGREGGSASEPPKAHPQTELRDVRAAAAA
jgi:hypothetical protein